MVDVFQFKKPQNYRYQENFKKREFSRIGKLQTLSPPQRRTENLSIFKGSIKYPTMNFSVDKLHVLKTMNREREPPVRKLSKYLPLPSIKGSRTPPKPTRPQLLREKTYDVLEPIYVKGPGVTNTTARGAMIAKKKQELPNIKEKSIQGRQKPPERPRSRSLMNTNELSVPKKNKVLSDQKGEVKTISEHIGKQGFKFNPSVVKTDGPARTVFWFPV